MKAIYLRIWIVVLIISFFSKAVFSQNTYISLNVGYGEGVSTQNMDYFQNVTREYGDYPWVQVNSSTYEQVDLSLGKGFNIGTTIEHKFNNNFGAELGISYLHGSKTSCKYELYHTIGTKHSSIYSRMFNIVPSINVYSGFSKFNPYAKFGLVIGKGYVIFEENIETNTIQNTILKQNKNLAVGINSAIGVMVGLSSKIIFYSEVNLISLNYEPQKGEFIEYTIDGEDQLTTMTIREKEIEYVDKYITPNIEQLDSEPEKKLKSKLPFGSIGVKFGFKYTLSE